MWDINLKLIDIDSSVLVSRGEGVGEGGTSYLVREDGLTLGGGHSAMYRSCMVEMCT